MSRVLRAAAAACVVACGVRSASVASAQTASRFSVQGSALFSSLAGSAYSGLDGGFGGEAQLRVRLSPPGWSLGGGYQLTYHTLSKFTGHELLHGPFIEPRRVVDINSDNTFPYVSGRFSFLQQKLSSGNVSGSATGLTANAGGGILRKISYGALMDLGATVGYTWFGQGNWKDSGSGTLLTGPAGSGYNVVVRVGLAVGLGQ
jgi:hypothetical protein